MQSAGIRRVNWPYTYRQYYEQK